MSGHRHEPCLLLWLATPPRWQRWDGGQLIASGTGWPEGSGAPLLVAVPGEDVALHWLDLPALAPAQASAAARALLADQIGEADPHVAVASGTGVRPVAVVARGVMDGWMAAMAAAGLAPAALLPDCLLLPAPAAGWAVQRADGRVLARSKMAAFAADTGLADVLLAGDPAIPAEPVPRDPLPINLLAGDYAAAPPRRWPVAALRRLALLAAVLAGLWLAGDVAAWLQARSRARDADAATLALARPLVSASDAAGAAAALATLARQRGADGGVAGAAAPVLAALAATPGDGLTNLAYAPATGLVVGVAGGADSARALADALERAGLHPRVGPVRATADGSSTTVEVPPT